MMCDRRSGENHGVDVRVGQDRLIFRLESNIRILFAVGRFDRWIGIADGGESAQLVKIADEVLAPVPHPNYGDIDARDGRKAFRHMIPFSDWTFESRRFAAAVLQAMSSTHRAATLPSP